MNTRTTHLDLWNAAEEAQRWMREATGDNTIGVDIKRGSVTYGVKWALTTKDGSVSLVTAPTKKELYEHIMTYAKAARHIATYNR